MGGIIHWHLPCISKEFFACAGGESFGGEFSDRQEYREASKPRQNRMGARRLKNYQDNCCQKGSFCSRLMCLVLLNFFSDKLQI